MTKSAINGTHIGSVPPVVEISYHYWRMMWLQVPNQQKLEQSDTLHYSFSGTYVKRDIKTVFDDVLSNHGEGSGDI